MGVDVVPAAEVMHEAERLRAGACPNCNKSGTPIEVRTSYRALSFVVLTRWTSHPLLSCRPCHVKAAATNTLATLIFGWWGIPFGLIMTPVQIIRNVIAMVGSDSSQPSQLLLQTAYQSLAARGGSAIAPGA